MTKVGRVDITIRSINDVDLEDALNVVIDESGIITLSRETIYPSEMRFIESLHSVLRQQNKQGLREIRTKRKQEKELFTSTEFSE